MVHFRSRSGHPSNSDSPLVEDVPVATVVFHVVLIEFLVTYRADGWCQLDNCSTRSIECLIGQNLAIVTQDGVVTIFDYLRIVATME